MQRVRLPSSGSSSSDYGGVVPDHLVNPAKKDPGKKKKDRTSLATKQMSDAEFERSVSEGIGLNEVGLAEREAYKQVLLSSHEWSECDKLNAYMNILQNLRSVVKMVRENAKNEATLLPPGICMPADGEASTIWPEAKDVDDVMRSMMSGPLPDTTVARFPGPKHDACYTPGIGGPHTPYAYELAESMPSTPSPSPTKKRKRGLPSS
ncbi:hypothetical protein BDZ89DRAFT_1170619 [Hymenopellis radicata]|nr:hypothetical protein BDZ89DRAFT_1170619 [Hymenopellis radicata]